ncbi:MAG: hydrogenase maturation nickel metallochaperone HypA [Magnetococcales bacterium]|nr:hydrogenase maturation nickel metallochaperone HypA [Magnetococcales bacterium]MBF0151207.1 hydrogenase maturation nickel metallochaperone HypA [Magnetococcales bacterium]MBF0173080.1 hydrogenase maturation nickel metallochaperone HypA [Magnetococcales bacterium]MBF0347236.1 hydrogenase maturation nickel metallochaperone HypA [Magnetococcales bacterium]MBF0630161.1 hydrogenase maturation nickel metallochaperone HypA [Magnetococcales bacterium]
MHEFSVCQALMEQVTVIADQHPGGRIVGIHLYNGPLSGVDSTLLQHAFEFSKKETLFADCLLSIENHPLRVHCRNCLNDREIAVNDWTCPVCASLDTEVIGGEELILAQVQLDVP